MELVNATAFSKTNTTSLDNKSAGTSTSSSSVGSSAAKLDENEILFTDAELAKANGACYRRWWKECPTSCLPLCLPCNGLFHPCRKAVSKDKNRYEEGSYSLDLVYLFPRLIICGFPSAGLEHMYRNPRLEIKRFLEERHHGNYFMFNFCVEPGRCYPHEIFDNRVQRFPYKDHNVPHTKVLSRFLHTSKKWLDENEKHVVVLHCKAGKGRAGMMSCALMLHMGWKQNPKDVLDYYNAKRVWRNKALTVPSQIRYVKYAEMVSEHVHKGSILEDVDGILDSITIGPKTTVSPMNIKIHSQNDCIGNTKLLYHTKENKHLHNNLNIETTGNIKITLFLPNGKKCGRFWLNMAFEVGTTVTFSKGDIDKMNHDCKKHKKFPKDLFVRIDFKNIGDRLAMGTFNPLLKSKFGNAISKSDSSDSLHSLTDKPLLVKGKTSSSTATTSSDGVATATVEINRATALKRLSAPQLLVHTTLSRPVSKKNVKSKDKEVS
jgi:phosphatidylinositol-3,4,5-trisphosphate 3-phosphatase and dual-specificity protein phosphatase PTEN